MSEIKTKKIKQGFGPSKRLNDTKQFRRFYDDSEVFRLRYCTVFRIGNERSHFRLGITLQAKGNSIERSRVKRQVREAFRLLGSELGCFDYNVVISRQKRISHPYPKRLRECLSHELPAALKSGGRPARSTPRTSSSK